MSEQNETIITDSHTTSSTVEHQSPSQDLTHANSSTLDSSVSGVVDSPSAQAETVSGAASPPPAPVKDETAIRHAEHQESVNSHVPSPVTDGAHEVALTNAQEAAPTRPRVQLNPTLAPSHIQSVSMQDLTPKGPVEIPKDADLDADVEAALNQAMSGDMQAAAHELTAQAAASGEAYVLPPLEELEPGTRLKGKIEAINGEDIHVELGYRMSGLLKTKNFAEGKVPAVGSTVDVVVDQVDQANSIILLNNPRGVRKVQGNWDALAVGMTVECMVTGVNKGGLSVTVSSLKGFLPKSQIELGFIENLEPYVNQKLTVRVTDLDPKKRNLVVSRKQILIEERDALKVDAWGKIEEGQEITGIVKTVKEYGAFVDLGGVDGLLHVGEISWNRINHPQDVLSVGQEIQVKILKIETDKKKISLGMKQLISNPWDHAEIRYAKDAVVSGTVTRMTDFGAFVELEKGVEGLLHISEIEHRRIATVQEVLKVGQEIQAKVLEFNKNKKRISLSMKALIDRPEPVKPAFEPKEESQDQRNKKQTFNPNLKGGMGGNNPGGLFGNPRDFK